MNTQVLAMTSSKGAAPVKKQPATENSADQPAGTEEALQILAGRLIRVQEDERRNVARELHDGLNQALAMLRVEIGIVLTRIPVSARSARRQLVNIRERVEQLSEDVRRISHRLHPAVLEHLGLIAALRSYCSEFSEHEHLQASFVHGGRGHIKIRCYSFRHELGIGPKRDSMPSVGCERDVRPSVGVELVPR